MHMYMSPNANSDIQPKKEPPSAKDSLTLHPTGQRPRLAYIPGIISPQNPSTTSVAMKMRTCTAHPNESWWLYMHTERIVKHTSALAVKGYLCQTQSNLSNYNLDNWTSEQNRIE